MMTKGDFNGSIGPPEDGVALEPTAIRRELQRELRYQRDGYAKHALARAPYLRVVLVVVWRGLRFAEHHADETVSIQVVSGCVRGHLPGRTVELAPSQLLVLRAGIGHVEARIDSAFVLTFGPPAEGVMP